MRTDPNAPITDVFLEGEGALPRINRQDKTYLPAQERDPPARCVIVEPFMLGTIPEVHAHRFLEQQECSRSKTFSLPCVSEERPWYLTGTHVYARDAGSAPARWPHSLSGSLPDFAFRSGRQEGRMRRPGSGVSQRPKRGRCLDDALLVGYNVMSLLWRKKTPISARGPGVVRYAGSFLSLLQEPSLPSPACFLRNSLPYKPTQE